MAVLQPAYAIEAQPFFIDFDSASWALNIIDQHATISHRVRELASEHIRIDLKLKAKSLTTTKKSSPFSSSVSNLYYFNSVWGFFPPVFLKEIENPDTVGMF